MSSRSKKDKNIQLSIALLSYYDVTNRPVAEELLAAGVPKEDIILGFYPESVRKYTDFGIV